MARERVIVRSALPRWKHEIHEAAKAGIEAGAKVGVAKSAELAPVGDGKAGVLEGSHLRDTYEEIIPSISKRGFAGGFGSFDPNALWQELGTFGRRRRKARHAKHEIRRKFLRQDASGKRVGVVPKRIMQKAAKPALAAVIVGMREAAALRRFG